MTWTDTDYAFNNAQTAVSGPTFTGVDRPSQMLVPAVADFSQLNIFNVKAQPYGAKGDGVSDDTAAIRAACVAAIAAGGGIIFFPVGTYLMSSVVTLTAGNLVFMGSGWGTILKQYGNAIADFSMFMATNQSNLIFADMQFYGNGVPFDPATSNPLAVHLESCTNAYFVRCRFYNSQGFGSVFANASTDVTVDSCVFDTSGAGRATAKFMPALNFGASSGISNRVKVVNSRFMNLHFHGIWLQATDSEVLGCSFDSVGESRIVNAGVRNTIMGNVDKNGFMVSVTGPFVESYSDDMICSGNRVYNAGQSGTHFGVGPYCQGIFSGGGRAVIVGNHIYNCSNTAIQIDSNTTDTGNGSGVDIVCANNVCVNNGYAAGQCGGIFLNGGGGGPSFNGISLSGNVCIGNLPFDMRLGGSYVNGGIAVRGNTAWPDAIAIAPNPLTGTTAFTSLGSIPIAAGTLGTTGGFKARLRGTFALNNGTAKLVVSYGGNDTLVLGGTYLAGDTITYTLNGHTTTHTVTSPEASGGLSAVASGLAQDINNDATTGPLVTATGTSSGTVTIAAKTAAFALAATLAESVGKTSASGTISTLSTTLILNLLNYTSAAQPNSNAFSVDITASNIGPTSTNFSVTLTVGTAVISQTVAQTILNASSVAQNLNFYGQLVSAADTLQFPQMQFERI